MNARPSPFDTGEIDLMPDDEYEPLFGDAADIPPMTRVEIAFVITEPQPDGSHHYFHEATGSVFDTNDAELKIAAREATNIQAPIEIVAFREI